MSQKWTMIQALWNSLTESLSGNAIIYEEKIEHIFKIIFSYTQALWKVNAGKIY